MRIFISYPHKDKDKTLQLKHALLQGGHKIWMDEQLITGQGWREQLEEQIKQTEAIALALTPNWLASANCQWEFITAVENSKTIIPVLLEKTELPARISKYQYADLSDGFDSQKVGKLLDDLVTLIQVAHASAAESREKSAYAEQIDAEIKSRGNNKISIGGNVTGANVNIGGTQTFHGAVHINYGIIPETLSDPALSELKAHLGELESALKTISPEYADDVELVQECANEIATEVSKEQPRKKKLEISGESLKKAAENLASVAPIAVKIAQTLLRLGH